MDYKDPMWQTNEGTSMYVKGWLCLASKQWLIFS